MKIHKLPTYRLISDFKDAVRDDNYNPSSKPYNESGFTLDELECELYRRLGEDVDTNEEI